MILVSLSSTEDVFFNDVEKYDNFSLQRKSAVPLFWGTPGTGLLHAKNILSIIDNNLFVLMKHLDDIISYQ